MGNDAIVPFLSLGDRLGIVTCALQCLGELLKDDLVSVWPARLLHLNAPRRMASAVVAGLCAVPFRYNDDEKVLRHLLE